MHDVTCAQSHANGMRSAARPVIVKIGGAALDGPGNVALAADTIAALARAMPARLVVTHGGGAEIDRRLARLGIVSEKRDGIRITPADHIDEIVASLAGTTNKRLTGALLARQVRAVGICIGDGGLLRTARATHYPFDPGEVGNIDGGDPALAQALLAAAMLPVISSIGLAEDGRALNVNADDAAVALARTLNAAKLMLLTDVTGVLDASGQRLAQLTPTEIEHRIRNGEIVGGMIPKVRGAAALVRELSIPVTIASWRREANASGGVCASEGTQVVPDVGEDLAELNSLPWACAAAPTGRS